MFSVQCSVQCAVCNVQYSVQCSVQCVVCNVQYSVQCIVQCVVCNVHYSVQWNHTSDHLRLLLNGGNLCSVFSALGPA